MVPLSSGTAHGGKGPPHGAGGPPPIPAANDSVIVNGETNAVMARTIFKNFFVIMIFLVSQIYIIITGRKIIL